jgi:hypothetical protein
MMVRASDATHEAGARAWWRRRRTSELRLLYPDLPASPRAQRNYLGALDEMAAHPAGGGRVRQW